MSITRIDLPCLFYLFVNCHQPFLFFFYSSFKFHNSTFLLQFSNFLVISITNKPLANFQASISYPFYSHLLSPKTNQITNPRVGIRLHLLFFFLLFWVSFSCDEMEKDIWFTHLRVAIVPFSIFLLPSLRLTPLMLSVWQASKYWISIYTHSTFCMWFYLCTRKQVNIFLQYLPCLSSFNHVSLSIWYMWYSIICPFNNYHGNHYCYSQIFFSSFWEMVVFLFDTPQIRNYPGIV